MENQKDTITVQSLCIYSALLILKGTSFNSVMWLSTDACTCYLFIKIQFPFVVVGGGVDEYNE